MSTVRLALCAFVLAGCGGTPTASRLTGIEDPRAYWESVAPVCAGYPSKADCNDGDMALFGGLLCAAGESRGCDLVRASQSADGEWWRSPRRSPGNLGDGPSFSRDMAMGVLLYLATTRDAGAASRWLDWIESNRPCLTPKPGGGCLIRGPHRYCRDEEHQSCTLTPGNWSLMGRVWDSLGLGRSHEMSLYDGADTDSLWVEAKTAEPGYEMHLPAVEVLLKARLDVTRDTRVKAAGYLASRQPDNPFFAYLNDGASPKLRDRLRSLCPSDGVRTGGAHDQWSWERDTASTAWNDSMGWDCLFLDNLLAQ